MPLYSVRSIEHPETVVQFPPMSWRELQEFLTMNPDYELIVSAPAMVKVH